MAVWLNVRKRQHDVKRWCCLAAACTAFLGLVVAASSAILGQKNIPPSQFQGLPNPTNQGSIRSTSALVVLDVVVSERGHPVQGLRREVFHIFEDGREQSIKVFEEHNAAKQQQAQPPPPLPPHTYSNFPELPTTNSANVLLLDAMNTPLQDQVYVRKEMIDYLKNVPPQSYMAIFTLGSRLRLVQGFTAQPEPLLASLKGQKQTLTGSPLLQDPNDSTAQNVMNSAADAGENTEGLDAIRQFQADTAVFQTDLRVRNTLDAMNQLADYLGTIPGRKNLIWLSGSFPLSLDPDVTLDDPLRVQQEYATQLRETSDRLTVARVAVYPVDVRGLLSSAELSAANRDPGYSGVSHSLSQNSQGPAQSSIAGPNANAAAGTRRGRRARGVANSNRSNPNSFAADDAKFMQQTAAEHATMVQIAEETGGMPFYDSNAIKDAAAKAIENGANYYTLAYVPEDKKLDGKFRSTRVELAGKDYQLAYRRGYFADPRGSPASVSPWTPATGVVQHGAPPCSQILFKVRVLPADDPALAGLKSEPRPAGFLAKKLKGPVERYWIDFAGDMHQVDFPLGNDGMHHGMVEFLTLAYDKEGKLLNVINRTLKLNLQSAQYETVMQTGLPVHEELDIPVGEVYLRFGVHDLSTDHIGTMEMHLRVAFPQPAK